MTIAAKPETFHKQSKGIHVAMKRYFSLLLCQEKSLNFKANRGNSATNKKQESRTMTRRMSGLKCCAITAVLFPTISEAQKSVLAGVGKPMKEDV